MSQRFYKRAAAFVLRAVAKHNAGLAKAVVDAGSLDPLTKCLAEFEPSVKEAAAWALAYIAKHNAGFTAELKVELCRLCCTYLPLLLTPLLCCVCQSLLKPLSTLVLSQTWCYVYKNRSCLSNGLPCLPFLKSRSIAQKYVSFSSGSVRFFPYALLHCSQLAHAVVDSGAISYIAPLISHSDSKLKRQVCAVLAQVAKHSVEMAEVIVEAEIFPKILLLLKDQDVVVRKNAATCIREIAKHTPELASLIVNAGGVTATIEFVTETTGEARLPGIMTLGYLAAFNETLALAVIAHKVCVSSLVVFSAVFMIFLPSLSGCFPD